MPARTRVLVGFAESLAAVESAWSLLDHGYDVHAFTRTGAHPALSRDRRVTLHRVTPPELDLSSSRAQVASLCRDLGVRAVMPLDDVAVHLTDSMTVSAGVAVAGPTGAAARLALDKCRQLEVAASAGLAVPPTVVVRPDAVIPRPAFVGPWIVKSAEAVTESGGRVSRMPAGLAADQDELASLAQGRPDVLLVQPVLSGVGEGVFGLARDGEVTHWSGHRRVRMMNPRGSGSSACRSIDPDPAVLDACARFIAAAHWQGLFMIELLRDGSGTPWFMELNGRTWGSMTLATSRGLDYPAWTVAAAVDPAFEPPDVAPAPHVEARHLGRDLLHLAFVARGRREIRRAGRGAGDLDPQLAGFPTLPRAARDVLTWPRDSRVYNSRRGHRGVLVDDTIHTVRSALRNRGGA